MSQLIDKNGLPVSIDSEDQILFNGAHYYRLYKKENGELEMISCTNGYLHNVTQETLNDFEVVGSYAGNEHLLACD